MTNKFKINIRPSIEQIKEIKVEKEISWEFSHRETLKIVGKISFGLLPHKNENIQNLNIVVDYDTVVLEIFCNSLLEALVNIEMGKKTGLSIIESFGKQKQYSINPAIFFEPINEELLIYGKNEMKQLGKEQTAIILPFKEFADAVFKSVNDFLKQVYESNPKLKRLHHLKKLENETEIVKERISKKKIDISAKNCKIDFDFSEKDIYQDSPGLIYQQIFFKFDEKKLTFYGRTKVEKIGWHVALTDYCFTAISAIKELLNSGKTTIGFIAEGPESLKIVEKNGKLKIEFDNCGAPNYPTINFRYITIPKNVFILALISSIDKFLSDVREKKPELLIHPLIQYIIRERKTFEKDERIQKPLSSKKQHKSKTFTAIKKDKAISERTMEKISVTAKIPIWILDTCGGLEVDQIIEKGQFVATNPNIKKIFYWSEIGEYLNDIQNVEEIFPRLKQLGVNTRLEAIEKNKYNFGGTIKATLFEIDNNNEKIHSLIVDCRPPIRLEFKQETKELKNAICKKIFEEIIIGGKLELCYLPCIAGGSIRKPTTCIVKEIFVEEESIDNSKLQKKINVQKIDPYSLEREGVYAILEVQKIHKIEDNLEGKDCFKLLKH